MALFRCRAHWKASQSVKGIHPRARSLKPKNRRHNGLSPERTGPGSIDIKDCRSLSVANLPNTVTSRTRRICSQKWTAGHIHFASTTTAGISLAKSITCSQLATALSRCAATTMVSVPLRPWSASRNFASVPVSRALVASSRINNDGRR